MSDYKVFYEKDKMIPVDPRKVPWVSTAKRCMTYIGATAPR
jgi:hypothetical protein